MMKTILIGVVCLLVGLVVGRFLPSENRSIGEDSGVEEKLVGRRVHSWLKNEAD